MRKNKAKKATQKRRARAKAKSRLKETERENWVEDRLNWIHISDPHDDGCEDECGDEIRVNFSHRHDEGKFEDSQSFVREVDGELEEEMYADQTKQLLHDFSIISWNVLADAYCSRSSHKNLPSKFQSRVFNRNQRQHQIRQMLRLFDKKLSADLIALQEVDPPLEGKAVTNVFFACNIESWFQNQRNDYEPIQIGYVLSISCVSNS